MNPEAGITGSQTAFARGYAGGQVEIGWVPTPGAGKATAEMFARMREDGAIAIGQILGLVAGEERTHLASQVDPFLNQPGVVDHGRSSWPAS